MYGLGATVVFGAVLVYLLFFSPGAAPGAPPASQSQEPTNQGDSRLRNLRFNTEVLQDARFKALRIFGTLPVTAPKPPRRPNPFTR